MKLSTQTIMQQPVKAMLEQQKTLSKVQTQLATGKKILLPSDDPSGTARANQLRDSMGRVSQYITNGDSAESKVNLEESVINSMTNAIQRIRELAIQSSNGTYTDKDRQAIGVEVEQLFQEVINLANSRSETGEYMFSGSQGDVKPFSYTESMFSSLNSKTNIGVQRPAGAPGTNGVTADTLTFKGVRDGSDVAVTINPDESAETIANRITTDLTSEGISATAKTEVTLENFTVGGDGESIGFDIDPGGYTIPATIIADASGASDSEVKTIFDKIQIELAGDPDLSATYDNYGVITIVSASGKDVSISSVADSVTGAATIDVANTRVSEATDGALTVGGSITITNPDGTYYNVTSAIPNNVMEQEVTVSETLSLAYHGDSGQRDIKIGDSVSLQLNDAGDEVFLNLASAVDPNTNRSLFHTIHGFMTELKHGAVPTSDVLTDLDTAMDRIGNTRAKVGGRLNLIDRQREVNMDFELFAQQNISVIEDVDMAEAISLLQNQMLTMQVLQQTFSRVSGLSMFNYL